MARPVLVRAAHHSDQIKALWDLLEALRDLLAALRDLLELSLLHLPAKQRGLLVEQLGDQLLVPKRRVLLDRRLVAREDQRRFLNLQEGVCKRSARNAAL